MDIRKIYKLSPTKCQILERLLIYRCLTTYQIYFLLDPSDIPLTYPHYSWDQLRQPRLRSLWNQLSQLLKSGLILVAGKHPENDQRVFCLSEEGLSVAYYLLDIPQIEGFQRTGWDKEHGYFPYNLYRPPKERLLKHHMMGIDFNVLMELLAIKHNFKFDFIDNRYSSVGYTAMDESGKKEVERIFRPDGEFIVKSNGGRTKHHCWVEFDMGTEKGSFLFEKFSRFRQFLDYIAQGVDRQSLASSIPDTVFFVTTAKQSIWSRWQNVFRNFMNAIGPWSTYLNLYVANMESLEPLIMSHIKSESIYKRQLNANLRPLLDDPRFIGQPKPSRTLANANNISSFCILYENEMRELGWEPFFTVTQLDSQSHQVYLYVKYEEYETSGISRAIDFARKYRSIESMKRIGVKEVIPVLIYTEKRPVTLDFMGCDDKVEFDQIFERFLWHDVIQNRWFDKSGAEIDVSRVNPLSFFARGRG
jgi:hypothetical protein